MPAALYRTVSVFTTSLVIGFPFFLWLVGWDRPELVALYLLAIGVSRLIATARSKRSIDSWITIVVSIGIGLLIIPLGSGVSLYYPAILCFCFLTVFLYSLFTPKSAIQRLAEKIEKKPLDRAGVIYTGMVTRIWCIFFLANGILSILLAEYATLEVYAVYNGFVAYLIMGLLILAERLGRNRARKSIETRYGFDGE